MSESVTVERGVRDRFGPQNEQLPVRQNESDLFARDHGRKKETGEDIEDQCTIKRIFFVSPRCIKDEFLLPGRGRRGLGGWRFWPAGNVL
jgi:hypothetical protein